MTLTPPPLFPPQEKLSELAAEKEDLSEKLRAEEERRKSILTDKNLVTFNRPPLISSDLLPAALVKPALTLTAPCWCGRAVTLTEGTGNVLVVLL